MSSYETDDDKRRTILARIQHERHDELNRRNESVDKTLTELGYPDSVTCEHPLVIREGVPVRVIWQAKAQAADPRLPCWTCQETQMSGACRAVGAGIEDCGPTR